MIARALIAPLPELIDAPKPLLVDARRAAELLGVSPRFVQGLASRGVLERVKLGAAARFRLSDLERIAREGIRG